MKSQNLFISVHVLLQLSRNYRHRLKKVCSIFQSSTFDLSLWNHQSIHSMLPLSFSHVSYCTKYLAVFSTLNHASHSYCFLSQKGNFPTSKSIQRSLICTSSRGWLSLTSLILESQVYFGHHQQIINSEIISQSAKNILTWCDT